MNFFLFITQPPIDVPKCYSKHQKSLAWWAIIPANTSHKDLFASVNAAIFLLSNTPLTLLFLFFENEQSAKRHGAQTTARIVTSRPVL